MNQGFLPVCRKDMEERGWDAVDFAYVIGDAYVDHPSFGPAIISRILEANGYRVGIISQPDWKDNTSIMEYGEPKLGFLVSGGKIWTRWSTIILYLRKEERPMPLHQEESWGNVRIMRQSSMEI